MGRTKSLEDPFIKVSADQTVGLVLRSQYDESIDPLLERTLLADCQRELTSRGFRVRLVDKTEIEQREGTWSFNESADKPDLLLLVHAEISRWQETVPEQGSHAGHISGFGLDSSASIGGSSSGSYVGEHEVARSASSLAVSLFGGSPDYANELWRGESTIGGEKLVDFHAVLIQTLFQNEFPVALENQRVIFVEEGFRSR